MQVIVQPDDGVEAVLRWITKAVRSLDLKQFTFDHPAVVQAVIDLHRRDVAVRVLLNRQKRSGEHFCDETFAELAAGGVPVRWSSDRFLVSHEKSIVIDGEIGLVSSFNLREANFRRSRDFGIVTSNPQRVAELSAMFDADWTDTPLVPAGQCGLIWSPGLARKDYCELIDQAVERIDIMHPKFADPVIFGRLCDAVERGVRVRLLCSSDINELPEPARMNSLALWAALKRVGGHVHILRGLRAHAKLLVADGARAILGSQNLDPAAFDLRRELSIYVDDPKVLRRVMEVFAGDWEGSRRFEVPHPLDPLAADLMRDTV